MPSTAFALSCGSWREDLEIQLRDGTLKEMTPEQPQEAIYGGSDPGGKPEGGLPRFDALTLPAAIEAQITPQLAPI
jgi:hypothetical protein